MSIRVEAWNVQNGLGDVERNSSIIALVERADADVVVFGEACAEDAQNELQDSIDRLNDLGFTSTYTAYNDSDCRTDSHGLLVASRLPATVEVLRAATRNVLSLAIEHQGTSLALAAVHFDDRKETTRLAQATALIDEFPQVGPRAIAGDLNTMPRSRVWCPSPSLANRLPVVDARPQSNVHHDKLKSALEKAYRQYSVGSRVMRMASGTTLQYLQNQGYADADMNLAPTMPSGNPRFQLDHILASREIALTDFKRHEDTELSDHRAISAMLEF